MFLITIKSIREIGQIRLVRKRVLQGEFEYDIILKYVPPASDKKKFGVGFIIYVHGSSLQSLLIQIF